MPPSSVSTSVDSSPDWPTLSHDLISSSSEDGAGMAMSSPSLMQWSIPLASAASVALWISSAEITSLQPSQVGASSDVDVQCDHWVARSRTGRDEAEEEEAAVLLV